jgi:hypothetical protein
MKKTPNATNALESIPLAIFDIFGSEVSLVETFSTVGWSQLQRRLTKKYFFGGWSASSDWL